MWRLENETVDLNSESIAKGQNAVKALKARKDLGFLDLPNRDHLWATVETRARETRRTSNTLVVLGMGGSSLGGRAMLQALRRFDQVHDLVFLDNVDADQFWKRLRAQKNLENTHFAIISKSGNTIETLTMAEFIEQHLRTSGHRKLSASSTVISELEDNPLMRWARKEDVASLELPVDVGLAVARSGRRRYAVRHRRRGGRDEPGGAAGRARRLRPPHPRGARPAGADARRGQHPRPHAGQHPHVA